MRQALSKTAIETEVTSRFHSAFKPRAKTSAEVISAGIREVDALIGGLPRGAITEIYGPASSGRTSLMLTALAHASTHDEVCVLVDTRNTFDPVTAANAGMDLDRLLWVRCDGKLEHAFKAADLLLQGGGFGLVVLDLGDIPTSQARRIISSWWYRFRRVVENKPTALLVIAMDSCVRSCATLTLKIGRESTAWTSMSEPVISLFPNSEKSSLSGSSVPTHSIVLGGAGWILERLKPVHLRERLARFKSQAS
jgi:recombination protein RecA